MKPSMRVRVVWYLGDAAETVAFTSLLHSTLFPAFGGPMIAACRLFASSGDLKASISGVASASSGNSLWVLGAEANFTGP